MTFEEKIADAQLAIDKLKKEKVLPIRVNMACQRLLDLIKDVDEKVEKYRREARMSHDCE